MAHTDHQTMRRVLRREIAGTIGLLTDEHDLRGLRREPMVACDDHATYLKQVEVLLRIRASQGSHTTVALFDPQEYAEFCEETGLNPDIPSSRTRFTAELANTGPTLPYECPPSLTNPSAGPPGSTRPLPSPASAPAVPAGRTSAARPSPAPPTSSSGSSTQPYRANTTSSAASPAPRKPSSPSSTPKRTPRGPSNSTRPTPS